MNLAERFCGDIGCQENPISPHFNESVRLLLQLTERPDTDSQLRMAAYEVLNTFVTNAAQDCLPAIQDLAGVIVQRLEDTIPLQAQIVSMDDRRTLQEIQTSLSSAITAITHRLEGEIAPQADRIMHVLLQLLQTTGPKSSVPDTVFGAISAIANATEEAFAKYMDAFAPFLFAALGNQEEASLCSMAIGLVTDVVRNLGPQAIPYCDNIMNHLLNNLKSSALANQFKPAILTAFGDIAGAIGGDFEKYLSVVGGVLQQAGNVPANADGSYEMYEYVMSLREGIMDAWQGIIAAMKQGNKCEKFASNLFILSC
jgi:importin subunit beta-1